MIHVWKFAFKYYLKSKLCIVVDPEGLTTQAAEGAKFGYTGIKYQYYQHSIAISMCDMCNIYMQKVLAVIYATRLLRKTWKKIQAWTGFESMTSAMPVQCSTNWAGSWSCSKFIIYPWRINEYEYICVTCVTCICTADERLNKRKGSCSVSRSYIRNHWPNYWPEVWTGPRTVNCAASRRAVGLLWAKQMVTKIVL